MDPHLVIAAPLVDREAGRWIRDHVLAPAKALRRHETAADVVCPCQWGVCGWCDMGKHHRCAHRPDGPAWRPHQSAETWLLNLRGCTTASGALRRADGTGCRWVCPCEVCERETR